MVLNLTPSYTLTDSDADKSRRVCRPVFNRSFLDPLVKHEFPKALCEIRRPRLPADDQQRRRGVDPQRGYRFSWGKLLCARRVKARESEYDLDYFTRILFRKRGEPQAL